MIIIMTIIGFIATGKTRGSFLTNHLFVALDKGQICLKQMLELVKRA